MTARRTSSNPRSVASAARFPLTQEMARAAATDAGNRSMRAAGRSKWSQADYNAAAREFGRLWPHGKEARTSPNLWPFSSGKKKTAAAPRTKRSSMTISQATKAAYKAGQESGDTGQFEDWSASKGLQGRGPALRQAYEVGVTGDMPSNAPTWLKSLAVKPAGKFDRTKIYRDVEYKGHRIFASGDGFRTDPGDGTEFEDTKQAKRFIDDEVKMGKKNPAKRRRSNSAEASDRMYKSFHGKAPDGEVIVEEDIHLHHNLAVLGELIEMRIDCVTGYAATLSFEGEGIFLCSNEDGTQLYIEGGKQALDLDALKFKDREWIKDRMVIGQFSPPQPRSESKDPWNIGYQTEKDFDDFETILYQHDLGEESGDRPFLEYEPANEKLFITGGKYFIKMPLVGTSPGIEN